MEYRREAEGGDVGRLYAFHVPNLEPVRSLWTADQSGECIA